MLYDLRKIGAPNDICKLLVPMILALSKRVNLGGPIVNTGEFDFVLVLAIVFSLLEAVLLFELNIITFDKGY